MSIPGRFHLPLTSPWASPGRATPSVDDMTSSRGHRALALAASGVLAVVAAGCSSASPSSAPTPSTTPTTSSSQPSKPSTPGQTSSSKPATPTAPHATEFNPPGDIPDNAVFVDHAAEGTRVHFTVPEGWAQSTAHGITGGTGVTTFTDKYNSVSIQVVDASSAPTVASAQGKEIPELRRTVSHFTLQGVETVSRAHGNAVHVTYLMDSQPNPVTGKVVRDAVERFEFWHAGQEAILTLTGPQNADNVDPWQIVSDSLQWK